MARRRSPLPRPARRSSADCYVSCVAAQNALSSTSLPWQSFCLRPSRQRDHCFFSPGNFGCTSWAVTSCQSGVSGGCVCVCGECRSRSHRRAYTDGGQLTCQRVDLGSHDDHSSSDQFGLAGWLNPQFLILIEENTTPDYRC